MKPGTKLKRVTRNSESCRVFIGEIYTFVSESDGFIMLKEREQDGHNWELKHFEIINSKDVYILEDLK